MRAFVVALLFALPLFAQSGDLRVELQASNREPVAGPIGYVVHVEWDGDEPAQNITLDVDAPGEYVSSNPYDPRWTCTQSLPLHCTAPQLTKSELFAGVYLAVRYPAPGTYTATARVSTTSPQTNTANDTNTHVLTITGTRSLEIYGALEPSEPFDPNEIGGARVVVTNRGDAATNVVVHATLPDGGTIVSATPEIGDATCTVESGEAVCRITRFDPYAGLDLIALRIGFRAPARTDGGTFPIALRVDADGEDFNDANDSYRFNATLRRFLSVTSDADDGSGSLRQMILDANTLCLTEPCTISLANVARVQLASALPALNAAIRIDGGAARALIDGSRLPAGSDGLVLSSSCEQEVRNLVLRDVPHHAIEARAPSAEPRCTYMNFGGFRTTLLVADTEISGAERGVVVLDVDAELARNVIHENRRSGVFIDGAWYSLLHNNVIVNNGASGVFVNNGPAKFGGMPSGAELYENVIHGNAEFGIARTRNGLVDMQRNSLARNGLYAYDVDLDLSTPNRDEDTGTVPNKPLLFSASYDPATNQTVIRGTTRSSSGYTLHFYASDARDARGGPQAERFLRTAQAGFGQPDFEVAVPGDLRGQWITATHTRTLTLYFLRTEKSAPHAMRPSSGGDTSELSDAIQVN